MEIVSTKKDLRTALENTGAARETIGLVPTMGALHAGHLSLIGEAQRHHDVVVCSIFVNPSQFTNPIDLEQYPRPIKTDIALLEKAGCDILFNPPVNEIYDGNEKWHLDLGYLEHLLEGEFRPGHFQGVTQVVYKLFNIVKPGTAFFGQKDYQQFLVIGKMVQLLDISVNLVMVPIKREPDGLAMSSRNIHLTADDRKHALVLSKALYWVKDNFDELEIPRLEQEARKLIAAEQGIGLEYFEIADGKTLHPAATGAKSVVALVAAKVGKTRLIDNIVLVHR